MHGLEYRAVKDVTFDDAKDCLSLVKKLSGVNALKSATFKKRKLRPWWAAIRV
jgi:hypothetical protein